LAYRDGLVNRRRINGVAKCLRPLLLALSLTACGGGHSAAPAAAPAVSPLAAQSGARSVRYVDTHGIEVAVPASWRLGDGICGTPQANTVLWNEDGINLCLTGQPKGLNAVEFWGILRRPHPRAWYQRHTARVMIAGASARRWDAGVVSGSHEVELIFPRRNITVAVLSPEPSLLRRILASVRVVRVDRNGCPTRPGGVYRHGSWQSAPKPFVPAGARRVVGCSYQGDWLDHSNLVGPRAASHLARALDAAPFGFDHANTILPSVCGSTWRGSSIVARFEYVARQPVSVTAHLIGCARLGASNGRWGVRMRPRWVGLLTKDAHYSGAMVDLHNVG
jgi:hypothetical protein